jgi:hypothetical protein
VLRLLILAGLGYLIYQMIVPRRPAASDRSTGAHNNSQAATGTSGSGRSAGAGERMVKCAACGVYVPEPEALPGPRGPQAGEFFCSPECRRQGRSQER